MKKYHLYLFFFLFTLVSKAQEGYPLYNTYLFDNYYALHPSAAGMADCWKFRVMSRQQWTGIPNAPQTYTISWEGRMDRSNGLGLLLFSDRNGFTQQNAFQLTYTHRLEFPHKSDNHGLMMGISYIGNFSNIRNTGFVMTTPNDPAAFNNRSYYNSNFNLSATYYLEDLFVSLTGNLLIPLYEKDDRFVEPINLRNYVLTAGYAFGNEEFTYEPSVSAYYSEATPRRYVDVNNKVYYTDKARDFELWAALGVRLLADSGVNSNVIVPMIGGKYQGFSFGYSYDMEINGLRNYFTGSHQIMLGFNFNCDLKRRLCECKYH